MPHARMTPNEQFQALNLIDYLIDLFTASPRETIPRADVLKVLQCTRSDASFFDPDVIRKQAQATAHLG